MNETVLQIKKLLRDAGKKTVSTAESITAGHLQTMLSCVSGATDFFQGGITAYQRSVKVDCLGVDDEFAKQHDCVHLEVAEEMAKGALKLFNSDYAIATCGYAENEENRPYAFFAIADASGKISYSQQVDLTGTRVEAQQEAARLALEKFEEQLRITKGI